MKNIVEKKAETKDALNKRKTNAWRKWSLTLKDNHRDLLHKLPNELRKQVFDDYY